MESRRLGSGLGARESETAGVELRCRTIIKKKSGSRHLRSGLGRGRERGCCGGGGSGRGLASSARSGAMGERERYGSILSVVGERCGDRGGEGGGGGGDEVVAERVGGGEGEERGDEEQARGCERREQVVVHKGEEERLEVGGEVAADRPP